MTRILAISGSLRAAARVAPAGVCIEAYSGIGALPLFNADVDATAVHEVAALRSALNGADAVLIASPECAHGVSGVIKNALDWMVANETLVGKPVALLNASPRATLAQAALRETLATMSALIIEEGCLAVPLLGGGFDLETLVSHSAIARSLTDAIGALAAAATR